MCLFDRATKTTEKWNKITHNARSLVFVFVCVLSPYMHSAHINTQCLVGLLVVWWCPCGKFMANFFTISSESSGSSSSSLHQQNPQTIFASILVWYFMTDEQETRLRNMLPRWVLELHDAISYFGPNAGCDDDNDNRLPALRFRIKSNSDKHCGLHLISIWVNFTRGKSTSKAMTRAARVHKSKIVKFLL